MYSVTSRIASIHQPYGGYIKQTSFKRTQLEDNHILHSTENISPSLVGSTVEYMTRFMMGAPVEQAFSISLKGAHHANEDEKAKKLAKCITGLNKKTVSAACKLAGYDVCYRVGMAAYKSVTKIKPDGNTIENIIVMVNRSMNFWRIYGPIVLEGFDFAGGYTPIVTAGDGDFLTKDTLWDFKVLKKSPNSKYTLQLLMYYIMGKHSIHKEFASIEYLGIFNPRKNIVYRYPVKDISKKTIEIVSHDVIGYGWTDEEYSVLRKEQGLAPSQLSKKEREVTLNKNVTLKKGDLVFHNKYGVGTIMSIKSTESLEMAEVMFDSNQKKKILTSYLRHLP